MLTPDWQRQSKEKRKTSIGRESISGYVLFMEVRLGQLQSTAKKTNESRRSPTLLKERRYNYAYKMEPAQGK